MTRYLKICRPNAVYELLSLSRLRNTSTYRSEVSWNARLLAARKAPAPSRTIVSRGASRGVLQDAALYEPSHRLFFFFFFF